MKKLIMILIICISSMFVKAQDPVFSSNKKDLMMDIKMKEHITYGGKVFRFVVIPA